VRVNSLAATQRTDLSTRCGEILEQTRETDVVARMIHETYVQRAIACLHAAEQAKAFAERDRWIFEAIAWHELAREERYRRGGAVCWPSSEHLRARRLN
jgi:hypothetical protein